MTPGFGDPPWQISLRPISGIICTVCDGRGAAGLAATLGRSPQGLALGLRLGFLGLGCQRTRLRPTGYDVAGSEFRQSFARFAAMELMGILAFRFSAMFRGFLAGE